MANDENKNARINQKSFVKAIKKYLLVADNPLLNLYDEDKLHKIFLNYWSAIINIIGDNDTSVLFKYNGVFLFCMFSISFFAKMLNESDFKVSTMERILQDAFDNAEGVAAGVGHSDFWVKGGKASGLNTGALGKINAELVTALHKASNTDRIRQMEV